MERSIFIVSPESLFYVKIKKLPDVKSDDLVAERLVKRMVFHMPTIAFAKNASLFHICV